jgi:hypothetical protein
MAHSYSLLCKCGSEGLAAGFTRVSRRRCEYCCNVHCHLIFTAKLLSMLSEVSSKMSPFCHTIEPMVYHPGPPWRKLPISRMHLKDLQPVIQDSRFPPCSRPDRSFGVLPHEASQVPTLPSNTVPRVWPLEQARSLKPKGKAMCELEARQSLKHPALEASLGFQLRFHSSLVQIMS